MLLNGQTRAPLVHQTTSSGRQSLNLSKPVHRNSAICASVSGLRTTSSESARSSVSSWVLRSVGSVSSIYVDFDDTISDGLTVALQLKAVTQGAARVRRMMIFVIPLLVFSF